MPTAPGSDPGNCSAGPDRAVWTIGLHCQCRGFEAHGHCKHVETTQAAGKLFSLLAS
jgi:hypothetical protein